MKILIIAYYWPPSGGSGVQRWLKFVKYLPSFGITPYVFTPENPSFDVRDEGLLKDVPVEAEVIHFPIWEPSVFKVPSFGLRVPETPSPKHTPRNSHPVIRWLRGNIIFPDPRVFWVRPSVKFLNGFTKDNKIDVVITTGPPHSVHLIGQRLKNNNSSLKWIADFRDPWSEWGILQSFKLTAMAKWIHKRMERKVLAQADRVITITPFYVKQLERLSGRKVDLITNGFDKSDFIELQIQSTSKFVIRHVGLVNPTCDPKPFMMAVRQLAIENNEFKEQVDIYFTGQVNEDFRSFIQQDEILSKIVKFENNVPHKELIALYGKSSALLLILTGYKDGEGFLPGKLFEYLATGLPIVAVGPLPSDANDLLKESGNDAMIPSEDLSQIKKRLLTLFTDWGKGGSVNKSTTAVKYSRKHLTFQLVELLKSIT